MNSYLQLIGEWLIVMVVLYCMVMIIDSDGSTE